MTINLEETYRLLDLYGEVLENSKGSLTPVSMLPASKEKLKDALKNALNYYYSKNNATGIENIKTCFVLLANFQDEKYAIAEIETSKACALLSSYKAGNLNESRDQLIQALAKIGVVLQEGLALSARESKELLEEINNYLFGLLKNHG
jgi:hypothetical protein